MKISIVGLDSLQVKLDQLDARGFEILQKGLKLCGSDDPRVKQMRRRVFHSMCKSVPCQLLTNAAVEDRAVPVEMGFDLDLKILKGQS